MLGGGGVGGRWGGLRERIMVGGGGGGQRVDLTGKRKGKDFVVDSCQVFS